MVHFCNLSVTYDHIKNYYELYCLALQTYLQPFATNVFQVGLIGISSCGNKSYMVKNQVIKVRLSDLKIGLQHSPYLQMFEDS